MSYTSHASVEVFSLKETLHKRETTPQKHLRDPKSKRYKIETQPLIVKSFPTIAILNALSIVGNSMSPSSSGLIQDLQNHEIDQLDLKIIELLQQNGRIPYRDISRSINAPEATVRYRMKRLIDEGIITVSAFINTGKVKHENVAYIELKVAANFFDGFLDELIAMKEISYISSVTGQFDIMLEFIYKDNEDLISFINFLKQRPDIRDLSSRTILKIYKAQYPARVSQE